MMTSLPIILDDLFDKDFQDQVEDCMFDCNWSFYNAVSLDVVSSKLIGYKPKNILMI